VYLKGGTNLRALILIIISQGGCRIEGKVEERTEMTGR
jgi:hypothetical protein